VSKRRIGGQNRPWWRGLEGDGEFLGEDLELFFLDHAHAHRRRSPAEVLQSAVLEQALTDLRSPVRRIREEAERYFETDDTFGPFAFASICHAFGIDVSAARKVLLHPDRPAGSEWQSRRRPPRM